MLPESPESSGIKEMAIERAKKMGVPLVSNSNYFIENMLYPNSISSYGSPAPYEYADSSGGFSKGGIFSAGHNLKVLYAP